MSEHDIIALSELNPDITLPWIIDEFDARNAALFEGLLEFSITSDDDERCSLRPEIARALGIEVAE